MASRLKSFLSPFLGLLRWAWAIALLLTLLLPPTLLLSPAPAHAKLHTYPESASQTMYRSRLSLRDNQELSWQVILFKRIQTGQVIDFKLRLVGFPGQVAVEHPANLVLQQSPHQCWKAPDQTLNDPQISTVTSSVGQYDMLEVMRGLDRAAPIDLNISLQNEETRSIVVPPYVVKEWLKLKDQG